MFKVQRHFENDNGKDAVWLFTNKENALGFFWDCADEHERMFGFPPSVDDHEIGFKRYITATFKNSDETYTQYSLEETDLEG